MVIRRVAIPRPRYRWAIFSASIVSTIDNPGAHLLRTVGRSLARLEQEAVFYEERANPALRALLRQQGAQSLDAFRAAYPEIDYRTLDRRLGPDLGEWLARLLATVDVALVEVATPPNVAAWVGRLTRPHLQTYLIDPGLPQDEPMRHDPAALEAAAFHAVLVGTADAAARYTDFVPRARIRRFGPLPERSPTNDANHSIEFRAAANDLIEQVFADLALTQGRGDP